MLLLKFELIFILFTLFKLFILFVFGKKILFLLLLFCRLISISLFVFFEILGLSTFNFLVSETSLLKKELKFELFLIILFLVTQFALLYVFSELSLKLSKDIELSEKKSKL